MPRKIKRGKRRHYGGDTLGENNLAALSVITNKENNRNAVIRNDVGENNIRVLEKLNAAKPSPQAAGTLAQPVQLPILRPQDFPGPILNPKKQKKNQTLFGRANQFLKRTKIISRGARAIGDLTHFEPAYRAANYAELRGYGKPRRYCGGRAIGRPIVDRYGAYIYVPNLINV